jgi:hypothetical protein
MAVLFVFYALSFMRYLLCVIFYALSFMLLLLLIKRLLKFLFKGFFSRSDPYKGKIKIKSFLGSLRSFTDVKCQAGQFSGRRFGGKKKQAQFASQLVSARFTAARSLSARLLACAVTVFPRGARV